MAVITPYGTGGINAMVTGGAALVVLLFMVILFGAAWYFTARDYGTPGHLATIIGFIVALGFLYFLGGIGFG